MVSCSNVVEMLSFDFNLLVTESMSCGSIGSRNML